MDAAVTKAVDDLNQMVGEVRRWHEDTEKIKGDVGEHAKKMQDFGVKVVELETLITNLKAANENASLAIQKLARAPRLDAHGDPIPGGGSTKMYVESDEEHKAFDRYLRKGEKALEAKEWDLLNGMEKKALSSDTDPGGGVLTAPTMEAGILHRLLQVTPIRQYARVSTVGTGSLRIIRRSTQRFTITDVSQRDTATRNTETTPRNMYQALEIPIYESVAEPGVTLTMLEDTLYDLEAEIGADAELDFAVWEGQRFVIGGGASSNEPQGFLTASDQNGGEVPTVPSGLANDISMDSLIACFYSLPTPYAANAVATFSRLTAGYLMQLKDAIGNYLWQPSTREGAPSLLAGYKWFESFAMPGPTGFGAGTFATGAAVVAFADWQRAYRIVDRRGIRIIRDMLTAHPNVVFKMSKRIGAQVVLGEAMRILRVGVS